MIKFNSNNLQAVHEVEQFANRVKIQKIVCNDLDGQIKSWMIIYNFSFREFRILVTYLTLYMS